MTDVLVVGSGAGAVHAAWPLVEAGLRVTMLDVGNRDLHYAPLIPERPWSELRRTDDQQHRYFLGDRFEGIGFGGVQVGAQLTPPRMFVARDAAERMPVASSTFQVTESLARGGLSAGWGAGVFPFDDEDLAGTPFTRRSLALHTARVTERIGVSGAKDDLEEDLGPSEALLPALELDGSAEQVLERYVARRSAFHAAGLRLGRTRLAACSVEHRGRGPHPLLDMDFWSDARRGVYRAGWTLAELGEFENFRLLEGRFVTRFEENAGGVRVTATCDGASETHEGRALVLAAGALGSARIALRSLAGPEAAVPVLCNPYTYAPVLNTGMLGVPAKDRRHSLAQLTAVFRPGGGEPPVLAQLYSYRSLLLFKLVKELPLPHREAIALLRRLQPVLGILGIHHADAPTPDKRARLLPASADAPERLEIEYRADPALERRQRRTETRLLRLFRKLGCWSLRRVRPGHGANIHYAGTLPWSRSEDALTTDDDGRLRGAPRVVLADGAVFPRLPAKGLTFTLMANADRVGSRLAERLLP